jgi:hypothetical protein
MNGPSLASVGQLTDIDSEARNPLGTIQRIGSKEYIYLQGVASTVAGDLVTYDEAFLTARSVASAVGPCAVALAAVVASKYGWYQIGGSATLNVSAAVADNAKLFLTATAGQVDDTSVAGDQVVGAIARSAAAGAGTITAQLFRPIVGVNVA